MIDVCFSASVRERDTGSTIFTFDPPLHFGHHMLHTPTEFQLPYDVWWLHYNDMVGYSYRTFTSWFRCTKACLFFFWSLDKHMAYTCCLFTYIAIIGKTIRLNLKNIIFAWKLFQQPFLLKIYRYIYNLFTDLVPFLETR